MLMVSVRGIGYPVKIETKTTNEDVPVEVIDTSAPCPKCTETPTEWQHVIGYDEFSAYKPGRLLCVNCETEVTLNEVK